MIRDLTWCDGADAQRPAIRCWLEVENSLCAAALLNVNNLRCHRHRLGIWYRRGVVNNKYEAFTRSK